MAKAKEKVKEPESKSSPLKAFVDHQVSALEEGGKALASLLPKDFREHTGNALKEGKKGWSVLFDGMIEGVQSGLDRLRCKECGDEGDTAKSKVKVEVE